MTHQTTAEIREQLRGMALSLATGSGPLVEPAAFDAALDAYRTAVLREAADAIEKAADEHPDQYVPQGLYDAADRLRRMADETATETPAPDDRRLHACIEFGTWFDRSVCAEPCGAMHTRCTECGVALDICPQQPAAEARQDGDAS